VAAAHPELFETREMGGDVETQGELTLGATVFDRRQAQKWRSNAEVAVSMDANGVRDYILRTLAEAAKAG
jgi:purine nucleosidase